ncbi:MAG: thioredoxin domain-containing protein [Kofleriaceae bacterium]
MQTPRKINENRTVLGRFAGPLAALTALGFLAGASCKKDTAAPVTDPKDVVAAADAAKGPNPGASAPIDRTPITGFDVAGLPAAKQDLFYKMASTLSSPCGKAHSLRTSVAQDPSCKRAPFAIKLVHDLIVDEQDEETVRGYYEDRYLKNQQVQTINVVDAPMAGSVDAPVTLIEFFDYGCPSCVQLKPFLDRVIADNPTKLKVYYKMYPLVSKHPDSFGCAQAALAARAQGKFHEMHDLIFEKFGNQKKDDLRKYAAQLGLDLGRFDADFAAAEPRIKADMKDGGAVGVDGTPTLFLNGRQFPGPLAPAYINAAIDEEIAVRGGPAPAAPAPAAPAPAAPAPTR